MTGDEFARLLGDFTLSAESGDGARFANHFTEDAVYHDYIYGPHKPRRYRAYDAKPVSPRRDRLPLGNV
jgi:hypothetical protein